MPIARQTVIDTARLQIGTPWVHRGRTPGLALDCVGLVTFVADQLGIEYRDLLGYSEFPQGAKHTSTLNKVLVSTYVDLQIGQVVVCWYAKRKLAAHIGIISEQFVGPEKAPELTIIHSFKESKMVVEQPLSPFWSRRLLASYDFPGVE